MKQLYQLQKQAKTVQKELRDTEIEAKSADGEILVVVNGEQKIVEIKIGENYLSADKKSELESALLKVAQEASEKAQQIAAEKSKDMMKGMGLNIPGL
ncbi:YbaB/EbfC family nucleoid-associated protein [Candidatus Berkelbacteria bacterium]|nr:YbaB/EbfC family nucleoid-associated protein [Candidatus Berkelbacteria bacterium]